jgi:hypothetical protein
MRCGRIRRGSVALAILVLGAVGWPVSAQQAGSFSFGLVGDAAYTKTQEREFLNVVASLNRADLAFVIHIGDIQADPRIYNRAPTTTTMPCVEATYKATRDVFQTIRHPFILTPGDNEWTDCVHLQARKIEPLEALATVRSVFYPDGRSLGQRTIPVESQSKEPQYAKFKENLRWSMGGVIFVTMHIVGSNDNFGRTPEMDAEQYERKTANIAWMRAAFAKAKADNSQGLVLMSQANPGFENHWPADARSRYFGPFIGRGKPMPAPASAFDDYVATLIDEVEGYDKPVAYLHGDTHLHRVDKPLYSKKSGRMFENFTRIETFGWPDTHWVLVTGDPTNQTLFRFQAQLVPENIVSRRPK